MSKRDLQQKYLYTLENIQTYNNNDGSFNNIIDLRKNYINVITDEVTSDKFDIFIVLEKSSQYVENQV